MFRRTFWMLKQKIEQIKIEKNKVVRSQKYEEAAKLRDTEKHLLEELEQAKAIWEAETKSKRYTVTEDNVAEVVAMMTGIPVQRVGQADSQKLLNMAETISQQGHRPGRSDQEIDPRHPAYPCRFEGS